MLSRLGILGASVAALALLLGMVAPAASAAIGDLSVTSHRDGQFISGNRVALGGQGTSGADIAITGPGVEACRTTVSGTSWACEVRIPNGRTTLTVTQTVTPPVEESVPGAAERVEPGADPARATPTPTPTPEPEVTSIQITLRALGAPTIDGADPLLTTGIITGSAYPRAGIRLEARPVGGGGARAISCPATVESGYWSCPIDAPTGEYDVVAVQFSPDAPQEASPASAARRVIIDRDPPAAPVITSPASGSTVETSGAAFRGTGESMGTVDVFASGILVCSAPVRSSAWACTAEQVKAGRHIVQAIQRDAAGNFSPPSAALRIVFQAAEPGTPSPTPAETPEETPEPEESPEPDPSTPGTVPPPGDGQNPDGSGKPGSPLITWGTPTGFGSALPALGRAATDPASLGGALLALLFIALVALPLRLFASTLRERVRAWRLPRLLGRNQPSPVVALADERDSARVRAITAAGAAVALASLVAAVATGLHGDIRDLRLLAAIGIGLLVVNLVGVVLPGAIASRVLGISHRIRLVPTFLLVAVVAAALSRLLGVEPPVLIGVVLAVTAIGRATGAGSGAGAHRAGSEKRGPGLVAIAQLTGTGLVAFGAWVAHSALGLGEGFWPALAGETLAAVCIAGFGSLVLLVLPVSTLPGQAIFEWSPVVWVATAVPLVAVASVALTAAVGFPILLIIGLALVVAIVSVGTWGWVRWVEPSLAGR